MFNFSKKEIKIENNLYFEDFKELLRSTFFIHEKCSKLDLVWGSYISKPSLNGIIYSTSAQTSFSEIQSLTFFLENFNSVDMLYLFTDDEKLEIYTWDYRSHRLFKDKIEVFLKNGSMKTIHFA